MRKLLIAAGIVTILGMPSIAFSHNHEKSFSAMDTNSDGSISQAEYDAAKAKWKKEHKDHDKSGTNTDESDDD